MCALRAVTFDAYGTVFDFESRIRTRAVEEILDRAGARDRDVQAFADQWGLNFFNLYDGHARAAAGAGESFRSITDLTAEALAVTYRQNGLELDPVPGTEVWLGWLERVQPYPEAAGVIERLAGRFRLAMVSDIDDRVIRPALGRLDWPLEFVMTSEGERAYKHHPEGVVFKRALARLECLPEEAVHVGDSAADVIGAKLSGMRAVWINRHARRLPAECPRPDWELTDLAGLPAVLEAEA
ncbi:MAG: HAD family hydrolase [Planctomycetota bacterium]|jgi:2-haloalkanoic acid dehalogenase type II